MAFSKDVPKGRAGASDAVAEQRERLRAQIAELRQRVEELEERVRDVEDRLSDESA